MTLFYDELLLRPIFDDGAQETSDDLNKFMQLIEDYYGENLFSTGFYNSDYILSRGEQDVVYLDTNSNLNTLGITEITVNGGNQNIFNSGDKFFINQIDGETNLYVNDLSKMEGQIKLSSGTLNLLVENSSEENLSFRLEDNFLYVDEIKQKLQINFETTSDANILIHSLNSADIKTTELYLNPASESAGTKDVKVNTPSLKEVTPNTLGHDAPTDSSEDFLFEEADLIIEPSQSIQFHMDDGELDKINNYLEAENDELDIFIEKIRTDTNEILNSQPDENKPISENIKIDDFTSMADYEDFIFQDAMEIIE